MELLGGKRERSSQPWARVVCAPCVQTPWSSRPQGGVTAFGDGVSLLVSTSAAGSHPASNYSSEELFFGKTEWNTYSLAKQGRAGNKNHSAVWNCSVFEEGRGIIYHIMKRHNEKDDKGIVMLNRGKLSCCRVFFYGMQNTLCREANETLLP